jgi:hypothetical protein
LVQIALSFGYGKRQGKQMRTDERNELLENIVQFSAMLANQNDLVHYVRELKSKERPEIPRVNLPKAVKEMLWQMWDNAEEDSETAIGKLYLFAQAAIEHADKLKNVHTNS